MASATCSRNSAARTAPLPFLPPGPRSSGNSCPGNPLGKPRGPCQALRLLSCPPDHLTGFAEAAATAVHERLEPKFPTEQVPDEMGVVPSAGPVVLDAPTH